MQRFLEDQIGVYFGMFIVLEFFIYDYNNEIVLFDGLIDALMRIGW